MGSPVVNRTLGVRLGTTLMAMHLSAVNTLGLTEFSYTRCMELYSSMAADPVHLPQDVYTFCEAPQRLVH